MILLLLLLVLQSLLQHVRGKLEPECQTVPSFTAVGEDGDGTTGTVKYTNQHPSPP